VKHTFFWDTVHNSYRQHTADWQNHNCGQLKQASLSKSVS